MKTRILLLILGCFFLFSAAQAQSAQAHSVTLLISSQDTSSSSTGTATVWRAAGTCPSSGLPTGATALTTTLTIPGIATYTDLTVTAGNTYCYYSTVKLGSNTIQPSGASGLFQAVVPLGTVTTTGIVN